MNANRIRPILLVNLLLSAWLPSQTLFAQPELPAVAPALAAKEKQACLVQLKIVYEAIQAYRHDHKELPHWLSDLVPAYLADASLLICPVTKRAGATLAYRQFIDPKATCSYAYEFCDGELGTIWNGGKMTFRNWKTMQMAFVGGEIPILRCYLHDPLPTIAFNSKSYETPLVWETQFDEIVNREELSPWNLLKRFGLISPEGTNSALAPGTPAFLVSERHEDLRQVVAINLSADGQFAYTAAFPIATVGVFARDTETGRLHHVQTVADTNTLAGAACVRLSPDGRYAVTPAFFAKTVVLFERNQTSGKLKMLDVAREGVAGVRGLDFAVDAVISPDSRFAYVVASGSRALTVFRIEEGKLQFVEANPAGDKAFDDARGITVSPDGQSLYVASSRAGALVVLERNTLTGKAIVKQILQDEQQDVHGLAGVMWAACSPDGKYVYTSAGRFRGDNAVSVFKRNADRTLSLVQELFNGREGLRGFVGGNKILVSADGLNVYAVASRSNALVAFRRDAKTGLLKHLDTIVGDTYGAGALLGGAAGLEISPDGRHIYVGAEFDNAVSLFKRTGLEHLAQRNP